MARYTVNKYSGRVYCGNGFFDTLEECQEFGNDGFCDKIVVRDNVTGKKTTIRIEEE